MLSPKASKLPPFYVMEVLERAQELERSGRSIIHLEVGEPDFPTPAHIVEAANEALGRGDTKYTHSMGLLELREAIVGSYKEKFGVDISPDQVIVNSGTSPAMLLLFMGLLEPGDEVIMARPHYACYPNFVDGVGGKTVFAPTKETAGFRLEPDVVKGLISQRTKAILINSPANPTGHVMDSKEYRDICEAAGTIPVISDEIYQGLVYKGKDHSILEFTDNAFILNGFSKLYAMTGWRLGYLIAPKDCVRPLQKLQQNFFICANNFVQHAGVAALRGPQGHIKSMVAEYDRRRKYMLRRLGEIGLPVKSEPSGAYYVLTDVRQYSMDSLSFSRDILEKAGVAVTPGLDFGAEGYLRFSYSNSLENIEEGMDRLDKYLHSQ
ncbi:putative aspartate aminotransferase [Methanocella paludicola SANAE]|uniref:Aminotransferase n=1 Tax=Methanocella paludicola (strain DSM 17711 / JCM 13418 / NBRC 101707 / SANAE) TaxID=304371 RepID=D1YZP1_METPS|nr:pyridoxal phosphate-dependent aminotransferase [Methanocella paludicola]BAI61913.1 putative aspartate aminotransferase [Methanocella paludicola SANAE]